MADVIVVGEIIFDVTVSKFTCAMHTSKVTMLERPVRFNGGGDAQNASTTMGNLGLSVYLAGRVGDDDVGRICMSMTERAGVDCSRVIRSPGGVTSTSMNLVALDGEASHVVYSGENANFCADDVPFELFSQAQFVSLHSLLSLPNLDVNKVLGEARKSGARTFADTTPPRGHETFAMIEKTLPLLDVFAPSYSEISFLLGVADPREIAAVLLAKGVGLVVIKLGADGCLIAGKEGVSIIPAYKTNVVNATGAGDNFAAGFLYGMCKGYTNEQSAMIGNACGAITVSDIPSTGVVKSFDQVKRFIAERGDVI